MKEKPNNWQDIYQTSIAENGYDADSGQIAIVEQFARIERALINSPNAQSSSESSGFFSKLFGKNNSPAQSVKGLYLFGTVGRGKTFLMDMFCQHIPFSVERLHFMHFMKSVHDELKTIKQQQNPLDIVAASFAKKYRILCLDEFMVTDITDAMLLYGLFKGLIDRGVVIITTTNIPPDDLYKDGLQRARFLPAIELIKAQLVVYEMPHGQDFRRLCLSRHQRFFSPLNAETHEELESITQELSANLHIQRDDNITINSREIAYVAQSQEIIWFTFASLCEGFRSQLDYIEIAKQFPVVIISDIPVLDANKEEAAKRFLLLIDELYDQRIDVILSSAVPIETIYTGKKIVFEYDRLQSRLYEMQNEKYGKTDT